MLSRTGLSIVISDAGDPRTLDPPPQPIHDVVNYWVGDLFGDYVIYLACGLELIPIRD